jgi:hypothetical protein
MRSSRASATVLPLASKTPNHEPPATAWSGFVTTYTVTFGGRWRLIERLPKSWKS